MEEQSIYMDIILITKDVLISIVGIIGIVLNVLVAFSVIKYKKMRNRLNILICNICAFNVICYLINMETFYVFRYIFYINYNIPLIIYLFKSIISFIAGSTIFLFMISMNRTFTTCAKKRFKTLLIMTWIMVISCLIANLVFYVLQCEYYAIIDTLSFVLFNLLILFRFIIFIRDVFCKNVTENYKFRQALCATNVITLIISVTSYLILLHYSEKPTFFFAIFNWLLYAHFCQPVCFVYVLTKYDKNFKICLCNMLRCKYDDIEANVEYTAVDIEIGPTP